MPRGDQIGRQWGIIQTLISSRIGKMAAFKEIMNWGSKAEVLEPESLREEIRNEIGEMMERYKKSGERERRPLSA